MVSSSRYGLYWRGMCKSQSRSFRRHSFLNINLSLKSETNLPLSPLDLSSLRFHSGVQ